MKLLEGKTAIITGATRGIGKGIAEKFAEQGANVAFTFVSSEEKAKVVADDIASKYGVQIKGYKSNAGDLKSTEELVAQV